jgi:hypothetical protein
VRIIVPLVAALALSGCATFTNPVSIDMLYTAESAYGVAISAAVAYHDLCAKRAIPPSCRTIVPKLQAADKKVEAAIVAAKTLAAAGPTVDVSSAVTAVQAALADFQSLEAANGVR